MAFNESAQIIDDYIAGNNYEHMTAAEPTGTMLADFKIVSQSSIVAMDAAGVVTYRKGFGGGGAGEFSGEFDKLLQ